MAASPYAKELTAFSAIRLSITIVSVLFANNLLSEVSLLSKTNSSLNVFSLVFGVSTFLLLRAKSETQFRIGDLVKVFLTVLAYAVLFHVVAILYGAPLVEQGEETFCWSLLMAVLIAIPPCSLLTPDLAVSQRIFFSRWADVTLEAYLQHGIALTVLGAWLGAFVIPLDWERPWQVWPVPCAVGALVGHVIGIVTSTMTYHFNAKRMRDKLKPV